MMSKKRKGGLINRITLTLHTNIYVQSKTIMLNIKIFFDCCLSFTSGTLALPTFIETTIIIILCSPRLRGKN